MPSEVPSCILRGAIIKSNPGRVVQNSYSTSLNLHFWRVFPLKSEILTFVIAPRQLEGSLKGMPEMPSKVGSVDQIRPMLSLTLSLFLALALSLSASLPLYLSLCLTGSVSLALSHTHSLSLCLSLFSLDRIRHLSTLSFFFLLYYSRA